MRRSSALIPSPGSTQINYSVILGMGTPYHTCSGKSRGKSVDIRLICGPAGEPSPDRPVSGSDVEEPQSGDPANRELSYGSGPVARAYFESRSGSLALCSSGRTARRGGAVARRKAEISRTGRLSLPLSRTQFSSRSHTPVLTELTRKNSGTTPPHFSPYGMRRPTLGPPFHPTTCQSPSGTHRSAPGCL